MVDISGLADFFNRSRFVKFFHDEEFCALRDRDRELGDVPRTPRPCLYSPSRRDTIFFFVSFTGSQRYTTSGESRNPRGTSGKEETRESRASRLQTRTRNCALGRSSHFKRHRRSLQNSIHSAYRKYRKLKLPRPVFRVSRLLLLLASHAACKIFFFHRTTTPRNPN